MEEPVDLFYMEEDLMRVFSEYYPGCNPDYDEEWCQNKIIAILNAYCKNCYTTEKIDFFQDYSLNCVLKESRIRKKWKEKFDAIRVAKESFFEIKVVKSLEL